MVFNIDENSFKLSEKNFFKVKTNKDKIVIGNTFNVDMNHYNGWLHRHNGYYKNVAMFTILKNGNIFSHFPPDFYSEFIPNSNNENIISIVLENVGWLYKQDEVYFNYFFDIYNKDNVFERKWRGHRYWDDYTIEQYRSLKYLINILCDEYDIKKKIVSHNTYIENAETSVGVFSRSNFNKIFTDVNPSFDLLEIKIGIETYSNEYE